MSQPSETWRELPRAGLDRLVALLVEEGYDVIAPIQRDGAIVYDQIDRAEELPAGWLDEQDGGIYRLKRGETQTLFGYTVGLTSWKRFLDPPRRKLWEVDRATMACRPAPGPARPKALLGVRACECAALRIQDRVFIGDEHADTHYQRERERTLIIGVNCQRAVSTCFCTSMGTGPHIDTGCDLVLTEFCGHDEHVFALRADTDRGQKIVERLDLAPFEAADEQRIEQQNQQTSQQITREMPVDSGEELKQLLYDASESKLWDDVAERCLSCANCTMSCPTCFCSTVEDVTDLTGEHAERWKTWDSCFTSDFSFLHGGSVRQDTASRYRQWLTHKLASWQDQFGSSGCVGCGRCITWCPVGIDLTEEVAKIKKKGKA